MSTQAARCDDGRKAMSPVNPSKLRSKAVPTSWPLPLKTGLPEFPPVLSVFTISKRAFHQSYRNAHNPWLRITPSISEELQIPNCLDLLFPSLP